MSNNQNFQEHNPQSTKEEQGIKNFTEKAKSMTLVRIQETFNLLPQEEKDPLALVMKKRELLWIMDRWEYRQ